jgi:hypothetical protein
MRGGTPEEAVWGRFVQVPPILGCNCLPRTAVNTTEMWQRETFGLETIDQELSWARKAG